jgi:membrane-associated phospholipid phosphatase
MNFLTRCGAAVIVFAAPVPAVAGGWDTASRVGEVALVGAALGAPVVQQDWTGLGQSALSIGSAAAVTWGLKQTFPEMRPDRSNDESFPSGHTSVSFAAAGYLHQRYGWEVGLPATLVAAAVGFARVEADKHHWYDVVASAAIGEGAALLFTRPISPNVRIFPWGDTKSAGVLVAARF